MRSAVGAHNNSSADCINYRVSLCTATNSYTSVTPMAYKKKPLSGSMIMFVSATVTYGYSYAVAIIISLSPMAGPRKTGNNYST
jgi:hypothetical protein